MAALAIPVVVLGSLYILSEQEKKKEGFQKDILEEVQEEEFISGNNKENREKFIVNTIKNNKNTEGFSNYETRKLDDFSQQNANLINSYNNSNHIRILTYDRNPQSLQNHFLACQRFAHRPSPPLCFYLPRRQFAHHGRLGGAS